MTNNLAAEFVNEREYICHNKELIHKLVLNSVKQFLKDVPDAHFSMEVSFPLVSNSKLMEERTAHLDMQVLKTDDYAGKKTAKKKTRRKPIPTTTMSAARQAAGRSSNESETSATSESEESTSKRRQAGKEASRKTTKTTKTTRTTTKTTVVSSEDTTKASQESEKSEKSIKRGYAKKAKGPKKWRAVLRQIPTGEFYAVKECKGKTVRDLIRNAKRRTLSKRAAVEDVVPGDEKSQMCIREKGSMADATANDTQVSLKSTKGTMSDIVCSPAPSKWSKETKLKGGVSLKKDGTDRIAVDIQIGGGKIS